MALSAHDVRFVPFSIEAEAEVVCIYTGTAQRFPTHVLALIPHSYAEAQRYVSAVLAHINEARDVSLPAVLEMMAEAREDAEVRLGDVAADDEGLRVATRAIAASLYSRNILRRD